VTASGQSASFAPVSVGSAGDVDDLGKPREADLPTAVADATQSIGDNVLGIRGPRALSPEVVSGVVQLLDVAAISLSGLGALAIYIVAIRGETIDYQRYWLAVALAALLFPFMLRKVGGYVLQRFSHLTWQIGRVALVWASTLSMLTTLAFAAKVAEVYSRGWATIFAVFSFAAVGFIRIGVSLLMDRWARDGRLSRVAAVVGAGPLGQQIIERLLLAKDPQVRVAGVFDDRLTRVPSEVAGCRVIGTTDDLIALVRRSLIDDVIIALPLRAEERIGELVDKLRSLPVDLRLSLDPIAGVFPMRGISKAGSVQMIEILNRPLKHWSGVVKGIEDRILGAVLLLLLAPLMAVIAIAIRLDSRGPVLFNQERFGFNNNAIRVFKFRTMHVEQSDPTGAARTTPDDPRVTRVGRILRGLSLDELPQLFNVFLGDMSLVGPRPHVMAMMAGERLYHEAVSEYFLRHRVRPGMTGWAQVHGLRGEIDTPEKAHARVAYDLWYIDHWSVWLDIKILFMTVRVILSQQNAY
jgi:Undecaprenyl-phosphate glucose phosphotransferase